MSESDPSVPFSQDPSLLAGDASALHQQPEYLSTNLRYIMTTYPSISLLRDAQSYPKGNIDDYPYPGVSGEQLRTAKSIAVLRRVHNGDEAGLLGPDADSLRPGYRVYSRIIERGVRELGEGDVRLGTTKMETILAVHDMGKSRLVGGIAEQAYGTTDHDMALPALVRDGFGALRGHVDRLVSSWLEVSVDADLSAFLGRQRGIDPSFNVGRHLQGESDFLLFQSTVHDVSRTAMAEFVLDLLGGDGHQNPDGPVKFSNIPPAFNGIAAGLEKIVDATDRGIDRSDLYSLWEEVAYPSDDLYRLGLSRDSVGGRAITRIAFMGREHQRGDIDEALANVSALRGILGTMDPRARGRVEDLLQDTRGTDLGFTPHVMEAMRKQFGTEQAYAHLVHMLDQVAISEAVVHKPSEVLTINFDNKFDWSGVAHDSDIRITMSEPDSSGVINAGFKVSR
ncbi:MAG TPA: hypothetical protein VGS08_05925 [Candidatus Saccharimonadales bacterium]|nr:hypothetical protein [Candidatus Saccharimonadales bacterium]